MLWARRARSRPQEEPVTEAGSDGPAPEVDEPLHRVPPPKLMRRERRALARRREVEIRDVGGLTVEMVRRDRFRPDLLIQRANDVLRIEQRLHELDSLLLAAVAAARGPLRWMQHCACGAPLPPGAHFCSHCGRPAPGTPPLAACSHCGQPLPAEANFCAFCGHNAAGDEFQGDADVIEDTTVR
jgi:hypothetical protein